MQPPRSPSCAERAFAVSVHDVSPDTWESCRRLLDAIAEVAPVPVSLLVIPDRHRRGLERCDARYTRALEDRLARGDELVLHGWTHLDEQPLGGVADRLRRSVLTDGEGEFATLPEDAACRRLERGLAWFAARGWPVQGFVAPAWLLGEGAWRALDRSPFAYTTTLDRLHLLPGRIAVDNPAIVYSSRSAWRRFASRRWVDARRSSLASRPLLRLALHPADAHPEVVRHWQRELAMLASCRRAVTKRELAGIARRRLGFDASAAAP